MFPTFRTSLPLPRATRRAPGRALLAALAASAALAACADGGPTAPPLAGPRADATAAVATSAVMGAVSTPFKGRIVVQAIDIDPTGTGCPTGTARLTITSAGTLSQLGRVEVAQQHCEDLTTVTAGMGTITAANGDLVFFTYMGQYDATTFDFAGPFTVVGGTGRFAGATGGGTIRLPYTTTGPTVATIDGVLTTPRGARAP